MKRRLAFVVILIIAVMSVSADYYYYDRVPLYNITCNVGWGGNARYFPYAVDVMGLDKGLFYSLKTASIGADGCYVLWSHLGLGADITAHIMGYDDYIQGNSTHLGVEILGDIRVQFGRERGRQKFPVFSMAILGGAAFYTNFQSYNFVPGGGLKLMMDFYDREALLMGGFIRITGYYFNHADEHYTCYDANCTIGMRVGFGRTE